MGFSELAGKAKALGNQIVGAAESIGLIKGSVSSPTDGSSYWSIKSQDLVKGFKISQDSLFMAFPALTSEDSFKSFDYEFVIHKMSPQGTPTLISSFILPIAPQSINVTIPTAISTSVTMKGIVEEHNGAPLRQISISGTTGVYPTAIQAASTGKTAGSQSPLDYLFANSIRAAGNALTSAGQVVQSIRRAVSAFQGPQTAPLATPLIDQLDVWTSSNQTGYLTAHNLMRFFDLYLDIKKAGEKDVLLTVCMHKDKMFYDCTLNNLSVRKNAGSLDYLYSINFTAWRRRETPPLANRSAKGNYTNGAPDRRVNPFAEISRALDGGIRVISQSLGVLQGFQSDIQTNILNPVKKARLLVSSVAGAPKTISNYSDAIARSLKEEIKQKWASDSANKKDGGNPPADTFAGGFTGSHQQIQQKMNQSSLFAYGGEPQRDGSAVTSPFDVSIRQTENSVTGPNAPSSGESSVDPLYDMFANPAGYYDIFNTIDVDSLQVNEATQQMIAREDEEANLITSEEIQALNYELNAFTALFSQRIGGNSPEFNRIYGIADYSSSKDLTTEDIEMLSVLNDMSMALDQLTVQLRSTQTTTDEDYSRFYGSYARTQGIDFVDGQSKFYIPFPLGYSMESLAQEYLGSVDRWIEIAALNGLKEPYIDEVGFYKDFRSSGSGNSFLVSDPDGLYIGQSVLIESLTQRPEPRRIDSIKQISSIQTLITVNGAADLFRFTAADKAKIHYFAPNTVNSSMMIAIPSQVPSNLITNMRINPSEEDMQAIAYLAQADFKLGFDQNQGTADVLMVGTDVSISRGYANLSQAAFIKLYTRQGDLLNDPNFGNPVSVGGSISDFNAQDALAALAVQFTEDPRFTSLRSGRIVQLGGTVNIELLLGISESSAFMPIKTSVPTN